MNKPILYQRGKFYVVASKHGYELYRNEGVAAVRCGSYGPGQYYLGRAIADADKRAAAEDNK